MGAAQQRLVRHAAELTNALARRAARTTAGPRVAAAMRNQCGLVIGYHFAASADSATNGEEWLLARVAPHLNRFIDVGANVGRWSSAALLASPNAAGIAVEPGGAAFEKLRLRLGDQIELINAAAGASVGEATFFELPDASELSSVIAPSVGESTIRRVMMTTVDRIVEDTNWLHVDLLKIDTEGFDASVLSGASTLLAQRRIGVVQFEYNASWAHAGATLGHELERLEGWGYTVLALGPCGLMPINYDLFGEFFAYANFVAFAPDWALRLSISESSARR